MDFTSRFFHHLNYAMFPGTITYSILTTNLGHKTTFEYAGEIQQCRIKSLHIPGCWRNHTMVQPVKRCHEGY